MVFSLINIMEHLLIQIWPLQQTVYHGYQAPTSIMSEKNLSFPHWESHCAFILRCFFSYPFHGVMVWICVCKEQILTNSVYLLNGLIDWLLSHSWTHHPCTPDRHWLAALILLDSSVLVPKCTTTRLKNSFVPAVISQKSPIVIYLFIMMHCVYLLSLFV